MPSVSCEFDFVSKTHRIDGVFQKNHKPLHFHCILDGSTKFTAVILIFDFQKTKIAQKSLNNGVKADITPFLEF